MADRKAYNTTVESFSLEPKRSSLRRPSNRSRQEFETCTCGAYAPYSSTKHSNMVLKQDVCTSPTLPSTTHPAYLETNNSSKNAGR